MRAVRVFAAISVVAGLVTVVACQEPTQVTIDVRLATARCQEIHGTAIIVGVRPEDAEAEVKSKSPHAQTTDCDDATSRIGTLVITPSGEERASVIVVASYGSQRNPTECQPPLYTDCIVARRQFTFTKHRRLSLPITIDPTCLNVPCDAFSTCRKGLCFTAEVEPCEGSDDCLEPGATADGGTDPTVAVDGSSPDAFPDGDAPDAPASTDSGVDGDGDSATGDTGSDGGGLSCQNGRIACPNTGCTVTGTMACCSSAAPPSTICIATSGGTCPASHSVARWCCSDLDCGANEQCNPGDPTMPRQCCTVVPGTDGGQMRGPVPMCVD